MNYALNIEALGRGLVYRIINLNTGEDYIGATSTTLEKRWYNHWAYLRHPKSPLQHAMKRLGKKRFRIEHIATCLQLENLAALEAELISQWQPSYNRAVPVSNPVWKLL